MPLLVHLAPEGAIRSIQRSGLKASDRFWRAPPARGVYCMPVLRDYFASHSWLRELRRTSGQELQAVHFRVADEEPIWIGHYGKPKVETTVGEAIGALMRLQDVRGHELVLPRAVKAAEVHAIRKVRQVIGWRFKPDAKGTKPCGCRYCLRGEAFSRRLRTDEPDDEKPTAALIEEVRTSLTAADRSLALDALRGRWRTGVAPLRPLLADRSPEVIESLAAALRWFRGGEAIELLVQLATARDAAWTRFDLANIQQAAVEALHDRLGKQTRARLGKLADDPELAAALARVEAEAEEAQQASLEAEPWSRRAARVTLAPWTKRT